MARATRWPGIALVGIALVGLGGACGPRVDCGKLRGKLRKCTKELVWAVKPEVKASYEKGGQAAKAQLESTVEILQKKLDTDVYEPCKRHKGRAKDAKQINTCLAKKSCEEFARCFAKFLRSKEE